MPQTCAPSFNIYLTGSPHTFIITPAMLYAVKHRPDTRFRISANDPSYSAHKKEKQNPEARIQNSE